jgi:nitrogen fixation/metabolism regulation signal transduction histidine kinase
VSHLHESETGSFADDPVEDRSLGSLVGNLSSDLSKLMRQELDLAKVELKEEDKAMDLVLAALIVTVIWGIAAAVLGLVGKKQLQEVNPKPEQTVETLKEDAQWLKAQRN